MLFYLYLSGLHIARRARNSVKSIATRFRLREICRCSRIFRICLSVFTYLALTCIHVQMCTTHTSVSRLDEISVSSICCRILREFKIPLTTLARYTYVAGYMYRFSCSLRRFYRFDNNSHLALQL